MIRRYANNTYTHSRHDHTTNLSLDHSLPFNLLVSNIPFVNVKTYESRTGPTTAAGLVETLWLRTNPNENKFATTDVLMHLFHKCKPYFDLHLLQKDLNIKNHPENTAWLSNIDTWSNVFVTQLLEFSKDADSTPHMVAAAQKSLVTVFDYFVRYYAMKPVEHLNHLVNWLRSLPNELMLRVIKLYSPEQIKSIARNSGATLTDQVC